MNKISEVRITKKILAREVNCDKCHNWYYCINGRLYNQDHTRYIKFTFVLWFDVFDLLESIDQDSYTKDDIKNYLDEYIYGISFPEDYDKCGDFFDFCNETIDRYNYSNRRA